MQKTANKFVYVILLIFSLNIFAANSLDIHRILNRGKLIIAVPAVNYAPFFSINKKGKLVGYDIDLAKDIAANFGVKAEFYRKAQTFDDVIKAIVNHKADVAICNLSETLPRAQQVYFTHPYVTLHFALLINRLWATKELRQHKGQNLIDLFKQSKVTIAALAGSSYVYDAKKMFPRARIIEFPTVVAAFAAVLNGKVNAIFHDELQIKKYLLLHPNTKLHLKAVLFRDRPDLIGMAVAYQNERLLHWLNLYLRLKNLHETADSILSKHAI